MLAALLGLGSAPGRLLASSAYQPQPITKELRCPVCGMHPERYPRWAAQIIFKDQTFSVFDSPADLFRFVRDMSSYDSSHQPSDIGAIFFTDYAKGGWLEASGTFFVFGSSINGPMNAPDLPAFGSRPDAEAFAKVNGGKVLPYGQVTEDVVKALKEGGYSH